MKSINPVLKKALMISSVLVIFVTAQAQMDIMDKKFINEREEVWKKINSHHKKLVRENKALVEESGKIPPLEVKKATIEKKIAELTNQINFFKFASYRMWTDATGKDKLIALLIEDDGEKLKLKLYKPPKDVDPLLVLERDKMSDKDIDYLNQLKGMARVREDVDTSGKEPEGDIDKAMWRAL